MPTRNAEYDCSFDVAGWAAAFAAAIAEPVPHTIVYGIPSYYDGDVHCLFDGTAAAVELVALWEAVVERVAEPNISEQHCTAESPWSVDLFVMSERVASSTTCRLDERRSC